MKTPTPSDIKYAYENNGGENRHFFERSTMNFFGDTMASYGSRTIDGQIYLYRKPSAHVNVFGKRQPAGKQFFGAWRFDPDEGNLYLCRGEELERVWDVVA